MIVLYYTYWIRCSVMWDSSFVSIKNYWK